MTTLLAGFFSGFSALGGVATLGVVVALFLGIYLLKLFFRLSLFLLYFVLIAGLVVAFVAMTLVGLFPGGIGGLVIIAGVIFLGSILLKKRR